jgi:hypothetical protein
MTEKQSRKPNIKKIGEVYQISTSHGNSFFFIYEDKKTGIIKSNYGPYQFDIREAKTYDQVADEIQKFEQAIKIGL